MSRMTARIRTPARLLLALAALLMLGGCVSYYERHYGSPGVYYGGYDRVSHTPVYVDVNPVYYPYWSLDYFYFSQYHHPYSFYVGYREPLYYPYPGWALGVHWRSSRYRHYSGGFGWGYPWYGFGYGYPRYSLGFFAYDYGYYGYGHYHGYRDHHRIRRIDRRLRELQEPVRPASRRSLVGGRSDPVHGGIPLQRRSASDRPVYSRDRIRGSVYAGRSLSRGDLTERRAAPSDFRADTRAPRDAASRRELQRRAPEIRFDPGTRDASPGRDVRRAPDPRGESSAPSSRRALLRAAPRDPAPPSSSRSVPDRARIEPPSRVRAAPPPRAEPPTRSRSVRPPQRSRAADPPRSRSGTTRSRRDMLRGRREPPR